VISSFKAGVGAVSELRQVTKGSEARDVEDLTSSVPATFELWSAYNLGGESRTSVGMEPAEDIWTMVATGSAALTLSREDIVTSVL